MLDLRIEALCRPALVLVAAMAIACAGCQTIMDNLLHEVYVDAHCDFGKKLSEDACLTAARGSICQEYEFNTVNGACSGFRCPGKLQVGNYYVKCRGGGFVDGAFTNDAVTRWLAHGGERPEPGSNRAATDDSAQPMATAGSGLPVASLKQASAPAAVTITEFGLPESGMKPGPIVASGQRMIFTSTVDCTGPCGVFQLDLAGRVQSLGASHTTSTARFSGVAPTADGGYCYAKVSDRYPTGHPEAGKLTSDVITCASGSSQYSHFLDILNGFTAGMALGADGLIWYVQARWNGIGRFAVRDTALFQAAYLDSSTYLGFAAITRGPANDMWFTAVAGNQIGRASTSGITMTTVPTVDSQPSGITLGPDGNLWFTEFNGNKIGRITPAGVITEFALPTANAQPLGITAGADGALWFTEFNANRIGRITRFGDITEYPIPTSNSQPAGIVAGPDGNLWFTEYNGNKIGKVTLPPPSVLPQVIEFYNVNSDHYFITANAAEAAAIERPRATARVRRT